MPITIDQLKAMQKDYYMARWENDSLTMEPFCACGAELGEDYHCPNCARECDCRFVVCRDPQSMAVVEKLIHGNPNFRDYKAALLQES